MLIDPTEEQLLLVGSKENIRAIMTIYQKTIGDIGIVLWDQSTGLVSIENNADCTESNLAFDTLYNIVENSETTAIKVERDTEVIIGDINTGTIDIGDIERLGDQGPVTAVGALFHETHEQYNKQVLNLNDITAHKKASRVESAIVGYTIHYERDTKLKYGFMIILHRKGLLDSELGFKEYRLLFDL